MSERMSVNYDLLADYVGGALEGTPEQERVAGLIATSPEWEHAAHELTTALGGVQRDLEILRQTAEPMPEDLAARFEGLFDRPRRDPLEPRVVTRHSKQAGQAKARRWKRWAAPVAVAAAALGLFAIGKLPTLVAPAMNSADSGRTSTEVAADAPGAMAQVPVQTATTWQRYDRNNLAQQQWLAQGAAPFSSRSGVDTATGKASEEGVEQLQRLLDQSALRQCLNAVNAVLPGTVDLVEYAYFEGNPALVISITSANGKWLFVAGPNCGQLGPDERYRTPPK